jgi:hypothetical protein
VASQAHAIDEALGGLAEASSCRHAGELARWLPQGSTHVTAAPGIAHLGQHHPRSSYTRGMSAMREELHHLVDQLPEERLAPVLQLIRGDGRRARAVATLEAVRARMSGVTGIDEELSRLRDGDRG